jgi:hypothetical protein
LKYILIFIVLVLTVQQLNSQPTLTLDNVPQIGDSYTFRYCDTLGVKPGDAGISQTWDFSNLKLQTGDEGSYTYNIVNPTTGIKSELFPDATYAYFSQNTYGYYKLSNNEVHRLGTAYDAGNEVLTDPEIYLNYPFTYGDNKTDDFAGSILTKYSGMDVTLARSGNVSTVADGYGTLILPNGTFHNLLRLKIVQRITDTYSGPPEIQIQTETTTYTWISDEYKYGLLSISIIKNTQIVMGNPIVTYSNNVVIQDAMPSSVQTLTQPSITSPINGTEILSVPYKIEWTESELISSGSIQNEILDDIIYVLEISSEEDFSDESKIVEIIVPILNYVEIQQDIEGEVLYSRVKALYGDITSEWSEQVSYTVKKVEAPETPVLLTPENGSTEVEYENVRFTWQAAEGATSYTFRYRSDMESMQLTLDNELYYDLENLSPDTEYFWSVSAENELGDTSEWSPEWSFRTKLPSSVLDESIDAEKLIISPNPANNNVNIQFTLNSIQSPVLKIYSTEGKLLYIDNLGVYSEGVHNINVPLTNLISGSYYLTIEGQNFKISNHLIVQ